MISRTGVVDEVTYLAYAAGWQAVRRMPERAAYGGFERLADQLWRRGGKGPDQLRANLARVTGKPADSADVSELSRAGLRSYFRYWCDAFRLPSWDDEAIGDFAFHNEEVLAGHLAAGRGAVVVLGHTGNWDHVGAYVSTRIAPVLTVAEQLRPLKLYQAFVDFRARLGMQIVGLGEPGVYEKLRAHAAGGGLVALLGDRDLSSRGIDVDFFGATARMPPGAAALAVDTGAPLLAVSLFAEERAGGGRPRNAGLVLPEIIPVADGTRDERIRATTQLVATALAQGIAAHPADWHMLQKVWLADLDPTRLAARDAAGSS